MFDLGFESFNAKIFNQDALENFFGQIKQLGGRDLKPNCNSFQNRYKTLFMRNFSSHNVKFNCSDDGACNAVTDLEKIISAPSNVEAVITPEEAFSEITLPQPASFSLPSHSILLKSRKKARSSHSSCIICRENIVSSSYLRCLTEIIESLPFYIDNYCHLSGFGKLMHDYYSTRLTLDFLDCDHKRDLTDTMISATITLSIQYYTSIINKILSGKIRDPQYRSDIALQAIHIFQNQQPKRLRKIL